MPAYLLANVETLHPAEYLEYVRRNTEAVQHFGGRFVVRGGQVEVLEGEWQAHRVVLIEFPDGAAARAWYQSPEYQAIIGIRHRHARTHLIAIVEGH